MPKEIFIDFEGEFAKNTIEAKYQFDSIVKYFNRIVLDLNGSIESPYANHFKKLLISQSEGILQHLEILSSIFNISSMFSTHSTLSEVLSLIVESLKAVLNFSRVIILLINKDHTLLECKIITGMTNKQKMRALKRPFILNNHDCIETKVALTGESYLLNDINDERLTDIDRKIIKNMERERTIHVPVTSKNGIIGVLGVEGQLSLPPLTALDVGRIQLFANHVGVLIENTKLYESIVNHKNRFESIVEHSPNGIIIFSDGKIQHINQAGIKLLKVNKFEFLGQPVEHLFGVKLIEKLEYNLSRTGQNQFFEFNYKGYNQKNLILSIAAIEIKRGNSSENVIIFQDITQRKIIDRHLERLGKLASIGTIAAGIAHEIRNPLTSISMDLDSLYESTLDKVKVRQTIVQTLNEIEKIDKIISNLLQFSRVAIENFTHVDVTGIIMDSLSLAKKKTGEKSINFKTVLPTVPLKIYGNPDRLRQMLINLFINAIEAIDSKGEITIEANLFDKNNEFVDMVVKLNSYEKYENVLRIAVRDSGAGIPIEIREKIFDPYFTTKSYGTGLGLAISSKIANEHQGLIVVDSELNKGTIIEIFIPNQQIGAHQ
jgi:PAS domain S-box-containing protein